MFRLKNIKILNLSPLLEEIVGEVAEVFDLTTVTSAYRPGDNGVHGTTPLRGIDIRCRDMGFGKIVVEYVRDRWEYDPERPHMDCAKWHDIGLGAHIHLQVHPNSKRK